VAGEIETMDKVQKMWEMTGEQRDYIHIYIPENAALFLQHGLIYRRFRESMSNGKLSHERFDGLVEKGND
jgi:hypothetical protein